MRSLAARLPLRAAACRLDPTPALLRRRLRGRPVPPCRLGMVYTGRSPDAVHALVADSLAAGFAVRLWALTDTDPALSGLTVGSGRGERLAIHAELLADASEDEWVVIADDDVVFRDATIGDFVRAAAMAGLDVAQPAHVPGSRANVRFTRQMPFHAVRETTFVESGPIVALSPRAAAAALPRIAEYGMGWGVEFLWLELRANGMRLGIIDGIGVDHLFWPGATYAQAEEVARVQRLVKEHGFASFDDLMKTTRRRAIWQV